MTVKLQFAIILIVFNNILYCSHVLSGNDAFQDEFPALAQRVSETNRLHIVSEITQNNHRIQVEEFVDFVSLSQLIQIKWHDKASPKNLGDKLKTRKVNLLILNNDKASTSYMYVYEPYRCALYALNGLEVLDGVKNWHSLLLTADAAGKQLEGNDLSYNLVKSIKSTLPTSPYVALVDGFENFSASFMGLTGLWLQATSGAHGLLERWPDSGAWRLKFQDRFFIDYYLATTAMPNFSLNTSVETNAKFDMLALIEIKDRETSSTLQLVNVVAVDFRYSDRLARDLFSLPIGFDCDENPTLNKTGLYLEPLGERHVNEFELVATKYGGLPVAKDARKVHSETRVRNLEIARVRHPLDGSSRVVMYHVREDRSKLVQDLHSQLEYHIRFSGTSRHCSIDQLSLVDAPAHSQVEEGKKRSRSNNTIRIDFGNGITCLLSEFFLDFLFDPEVNGLDEMRLLNVLPSSPTKSELVFEQKPHSTASTVQAHISLSDASGQHLSDYQVSIVRVYGQKVLKRRHDGNRLGPMFKSNSLSLKRLMLLIFDKKKETRWAELRFNVVREVQTLKFLERAKLFDLSLCYDMDRESMEVSALYPADFHLVEFAQQNERQLIERFYGTAADWARDNVGRGDSPAGLEERAQVGASFNWLRVPKVELAGNLNGGEPDLELRLTILERVSPLYQFERVAESTFTVEWAAGEEEGEEPTTLVTQTAGQCAEFCRHPLECRMFAWNGETRECKLTHLLPLLAGPSNSTADRGTPTARLTLRASSSVYYEPERLRGPRPKEASLAQLYSFIEHEARSLSELEPSEKEADEEETLDDVRSTRERRATSGDQRVLSFDFLDKSNLANEYAPSKLRLLEPSSLRASKLPLTLDVSGVDNDRLRLRLAQAFKLKLAGRLYKLNALDEGPAEPGSEEAAVPAEILAQDERTFIDRKNRAYFTLKRLRSISEEECALLCYNLNHWSSRNSSEQVCSSFSYAAYEAECIMAIRTDFGFVASVLDLTHDGDRVHDIDSLEQLEVDGYDCFIVKRNYLLDFEGPLKLGLDCAASEMSQSISEEYSAVGIGLSWLTVFAAESPHERQSPEQQRELCAERCAHWRRSRPKRSEQFCMAFDYRDRVELASGQDDLVQGQGRRRKLSCDLLLVEMGEGRTRRAASMLKALRQQLISAGTSGAEGGASRKKERYSVSECSRYIVSHLRDFNHLAKRRLDTIVATESAQLELISETSNGFNLDTCSLECSLMGDKCVLFQFCMVSKPKMARNCTLFGVSAQQETKLTEGQRGRDDFQQAETSGKLTYTTYSNDCHLYLRREFNSISQILDHYSLSRRRQMDNKFTHHLLVIWFTLLYLSACIGVAVYVKKELSISMGEQMRDAVSQVNERIKRPSQ